jgi:MerR family transcriptional regulator, thiopeptide resistance regulator
MLYAGAIIMSNDKKVFQRQDEEQEKQYQREARLQYNPSMVNDSIKRWNNYSKDEQDAIMEEGNQIYVDLAEMMTDGKDAKDNDVRAVLDRWQNHIRYFYEPSLDILRGLGQLYNSSPDFMANFQKIHADLPAYLENVIDYYVDELETAEIERMLAEDEENMNQRRNNLSM